MATDHILSLLIGERDKLEAAIHALQGSQTTEKSAGPGRRAVRPPVERGPKAHAAAAPPAPAKRKLSAAGRQAIVAATKKRWEAIKAAKAVAEVPAPVAVTPKAAPAKAPAAKKKGGLTEEGRKALSIAMKKRWEAKKKATKKKA